MSAPPKVSARDLRALEQGLSPAARRAVTKAVRAWARVKRSGGRVVAVCGSGPHLHEGVSCLIAALVSAGLVDGVLTSSAVVAHEMAGALERVRRVDGGRLGLAPDALPADGMVEAALLSPERLAVIGREMNFDPDLYRRMVSAPGPEIIKVAGNLAYPTGLWTERAALRILPLARAAGLPLEQAAGLGCDARTMLGACARRGVPLLVTVPQLVGGGQVGLCIGDSVSVSRRSSLVARLLASADLIIESGLALAQEIHDGPFELYTGHGLWARHEGLPTYSLGNKTVVRIDLDPAIEAAWRAQRAGGTVAAHIHQGRPKAKGMKLPFRMEMSGFARLPGALPITGDLGAVWPVLAAKAARALGVKPAFMCYKQDTPLGAKIRDFIVDNLNPLDPSLVVRRLGGPGGPA